MPNSKTMAHVKGCLDNGEYRSASKLYLASAHFYSVRPNVDSSRIDRQQSPQRLHKESPKVYLYSIELRLVLALPASGSGPRLACVQTPPI